MAESGSVCVHKSSLVWQMERIRDVQKSERFALCGKEWHLVLQRKYGGTFLCVSLLSGADVEIKTAGIILIRTHIQGLKGMPVFQQFTHVDITVASGTYIWSASFDSSTASDELSGDDGSVTFIFNFEYKRGHSDIFGREVSTQTSASTDPLPAFECLSLDLQHLLDDSIPPDVTLKCGDRTIPAHRNILSARSDVFLAMFRSDVAESRRGVIEIPHMEPAILDQLLQFIYSCKLPNMTVDTAPQFYEAADKYGVESLREVCSAFMAENLTEGNACCILLLADAHSDCDLKDGVVSFIVRTELCEKDEIWLQFRKDHPILAVEVLNRVRKSLP